MMNFLFDPNVAYVMLVGGLLLAVLATFTPGTGLLELGALLMLGLAGVSIASLGVNWWALLILLAGGAVFVIGLRRARQYTLLGAGFLVMAIGSLFLIPAPQAINPLVVVFVLLISCAFVWWAGRRSLEAMKLPPQHLFSQIGATGEARTDIFAEGTVSVGGEEWTGRSKTFIPAGSPVRVVGREGLVLVVELYKS